MHSEFPEPVVAKYQSLFDKGNLGGGIQCTYAGVANQSRLGCRQIGPQIFHGFDLAAAKLVHGFFMGFPETP